MHRVSLAANFHVEEYKRPKFQVTMEKPSDAIRLNDPIEIEGKAKAYNGSGIGGAKVRYRVVRQVRYPHWWGWYYWYRTQSNQSQEIKHGVVKTEPDGSFKIKFEAVPDKSVAEKEQPTFF